MDDVNRSEGLVSYISSTSCGNWELMAVFEQRLVKLGMRAIRMSFKNLSLAVLAFPLMSLPNATLAADIRYGQTFSDKSATGEELANAFFDLLSNTGSPTGTVGTTAEQDEASRALVKPYLDPAFQIQRASGERYTAENYLPADVDE